MEALRRQSWLDSRNQGFFGPVRSAYVPLFRLLVYFTCFFMQTYTGHFVFYATSFCVRIFSKDCLMRNFVVVFQCLIFLSELGACRGAVSVAHMVLVGLDLVAGRVTS